MKLKNPVFSIIVLGFIVTSTTAVARIETSYLVIHPADFVPRTNFISYDWRMTDTTLGTLSYSSGGLDLRAVAPIHLPHGATIIKAELYYTSFNGGSEGSVVAAFYRYDLAQDDFQHVFYLNSEGNGSGVDPVTSGMLNIPIDNSHNTYSLILEISNGEDVLDDLFRSFVITYQYNTVNTAVVIPMP